jgi:hypothetical protein
VRQGSGRRTTACRALTSSPGRPSSSSPRAAALGPSCAHGENSIPGHSRRPKVSMCHAAGVCWAPPRLTGMADLFHCTLDLQLGAHMGWKGQHTCGGSIPGSRLGAQNLNGGHTMGGVLSSISVHCDRWLHCKLLPQPGAYVDTIEVVSMSGSSWF